MNADLVLIVDDDAALLERATDYLQHHGLRVLATSQVFSVSSIVSNQKPRVIVLDVNMPTLAGDKLANTIGKFYELPIIFYSAITEDAGAALAREHNGAVFVSKAAGLRALYHAVSKTLGRPSIAAKVRLAVPVARLTGRQTDADGTER